MVEVTKTLPPREICSSEARLQHPGSDRSANVSTIDQDCISLHVLCVTCQRVVGSSALLARRRPLWSKVDDEEILHWSSGRQLRAAAERDCHLCNLILSSLLNERSRFSKGHHEEGNIVLRIWDGT